VYTCVSYFARHGQKNNVGAEDAVVGVGSRVGGTEQRRGTGGKVGGKADLLAMMAESWHQDEKGMSRKKERGRRKKKRKLHSYQIVL
jgi:delta 1-pyrroline-5-carboxylate dehydrogenase